MAQATGAQLATSSSIMEKKEILYFLLEENLDVSL